MNVRKTRVNPELIGTYCIASDEYAGTYRGIIRGGHEGFNELRLVIEIHECIVPPSNKAELIKDAIVNRKPYPVGSLQQFGISQVKQLLEETA